MATSSSSAAKEQPHEQAQDGEEVDVGENDWPTGDEPTTIVDEDYDDEGRVRRGGNPIAHHVRHLQ